MSKSTSDGNEAAARCRTSGERSHCDPTQLRPPRPHWGNGPISGLRREPPTSGDPVPFSHRNAERGRGCRGSPRRAARRSADHYVHFIAGAAVDDPEHVQNRGRTDPHRFPCRGAGVSGARSVDFRRSPGRDGRSLHRIRHAGVAFGASCDGHGADRACSGARIRLPFVHFFDGFRTSHEVAKVEQLSVQICAR